MSRKIFAHSLTRGLDLNNCDARKIRFNIVNAVQINLAVQAYAIERLSLNDHIILGERDDQVFPLFRRWHQIACAFRSQQRQRSLCRSASREKFGRRQRL